MALLDVETPWVPRPRRRGGMVSERFDGRERGAVAQGHAARR
jgi:hypothetical protein